MYAVRHNCSWRDSGAPLPATSHDSDEGITVARPRRPSPVLPPRGSNGGRACVAVVRPLAMRSWHGRLVSSQEMVHRGFRGISATGGYRGMQEIIT